MDYQKGRVLCDVSEELTAQSFQTLIEKNVLPAYSGRKIIMILDNSKIHHAKALADFKEKYKDVLTFWYLPPYAPAINRIEGLWKWFKETVICNRFLHGVDEIRGAVLEFLSYIRFRSSDIRTRLCW